MTKSILESDEMYLRTVYDALLSTLCKNTHEGDGGNQL